MASKRWVPKALEIVLQHNHLSDQALAAQLTGRTAGAVAATRDAPHVYHTGGQPTFGLSQPLQQWLAVRPGAFGCPGCNAPL